MIKFGTGGFRGVIADDFTKENVQKVAQGLADIAVKYGWNEKPIAVGYDFRFMSDMFAVWAAEVLAANGIKVLLCDGAVSTPVVMSATKELGNELGVMITASHNPYVFNGVKVFRKNGMDADVAFTDELEKVTNAIETVRTLPIADAKACGAVKDFSHLDKYIENIISFIDPNIRNNNVKILFDDMYGTGRIGLVPIAKKLNIARFDVVNANRDAFFGFMAPNPTEEAMARLADTVVKNGYDFAMATDCDADRLGVIDEKGNSVSSNQILACLYYYLVHCRGMRGDVVKNCTTSLLLDMLAEKFGFKCHEVDVGFKNVSAKIKETDALIGGESSGGLTIRNYIFGKDSTFSATLFAEMRVIMNKPVSEIVQEVERFAGYNYCWLESAQKVSDMRILEILKKDKGKDLGAKRVHAFNSNVKYYFDDGSWALLRASGTEPLFRIAVETKSRMQSEAMMRKLKIKLAESDAKSA